jgi:hypothetical protein
VPSEAKIWARMDNNVMLACPTYEDWFGFTVKDAQEMPLSSLVINGLPKLQA